MSYSLNSLNLEGLYKGIIEVITLGVIKWDTRSLDYSSYNVYNTQTIHGMTHTYLWLARNEGMAIIRIIIFWGLYWGCLVLTN